MRGFLNVLMAIGLDSLLGLVGATASDLVPELHKEKDLKKSTKYFLTFLLGVAFMIGIKIMVHR